MAEKMTIEIFRKKDAEEFTLALADPESRTAIGSGAAMTAAAAAAYLHRAAALCAQEQGEDERLAWLMRNSETLRSYMVKLIDEDVKCRGPLRRARSEGDAQAIEAAHQPAAAIANEIVNMMTQCLEMLEELTGRARGDAMTCIAAAAELAMGSIRACMHYCVALSRECSDETYRYVVRRENEMTREKFTPVYERILEKTKE